MQLIECFDRFYPFDKYLINKFGLVAKECLFIDDSKASTDGAEAVGIHGYTFDGDTKKLDEYITELKK